MLKRGKAVQAEGGPTLMRVPCAHVLPVATRCATHQEVPRQRGLALVLRSDHTAWPGTRYSRASVSVIRAEPP